MKIITSLTVWFFLLSGSVEAQSAATSRDTIWIFGIQTETSFPDSLRWVVLAYHDFLTEGFSSIPDIHVLRQEPALKTINLSADDLNRQCRSVGAKAALIVHISADTGNLRLKWVAHLSGKTGPLSWIETPLALASAGDMLIYPANLITEILKLMNKNTKSNQERIKKYYTAKKRPELYRFFYSARAAEQKGNPDSAETLYALAVKADTLFIRGYVELARIQRLRKKYDPALMTYTKLVRLDSLNSEWYRAVGDIYYYHKDEISHAKRWYQRAVQVNPKDVQAMLQTGYCELTLKEYELASYQARQALTLDSMNSDAYNLLGLTAIAAGDTLRAENFFLKATRVNAKEISARKNLARLYQERGLPDKAWILLSEAAKTDPLDASVRLTLAGLYYHQQNYFQSVFEFIAAVILKPEYENSRTNPVQILSLVTKNKKDLRLVQSIADSLKQRILETESDSDEEYWLRAALGYLQLYYLEQYGEAVNHFQSIRNIRPEITRLFYFTGEALYRLEKWNLASQALTRYATEANDPFSYARTLLMLAKIALRQNRLEEAELTVLKSLRFYPNAEAYYVYGTALSRNRKWNEAIQQFHKAVTVFPNYTEAYVEMGNAYYHLNQTREAIEAFQKATALDSTNITLRQSLAAFYLQQGNYSDAMHQTRIAFELARRKKTELPVLYGIYGEILYQQGKYKESLKAFETQARLDTVSAEPLFRIACVYAATKKYDRAVEGLEKLLARGYRLFSRIEQEPTFAPLKEKKKYRELMTRYRKQFEDELLKKR